MLQTLIPTKAFQMKKDIKFYKIVTGLIRVDFFEIEKKEYYRIYNARKRDGALDSSRFDRVHRKFIVHYIHDYKKQRNGKG